jgi:hypothetical protein
MIWVDGSLIADGTAANMVNFTQNSTTWNGIIAEGNSVINFNYVKFNNATGITVQNTGVFTNSKFRDITDNPIYFDIYRKNGNLTVNNCNFTLTGTAANDIFGDIYAWANATNTNTFSVPISITNNYFGPGMAGDAVIINAAVNPVNSAVLTFNNNILISGNWFNIGARPAIAITRTIDAWDNSTVMVNGNLNINTNRFNCGPAVSYVNNVFVHDLASPKMTHVNSVAVASSVQFVNNDLRGASSYGLDDIATLVAYGQKTSSITDPITMTGNNFTLSSGDAVLIQRTSTTFENATANINGDVLVDKNMMENVVRGVSIYKIFNTASLYNDTITYTSAEKISNNTDTLGTGAFLTDELSSSATGYGHLSVADGLLVSDNTVTNIGASTAIVWQHSMNTAGHSVGSVAAPLTAINNNVNTAGGLATIGLTYTSAGSSVLTVKDDTLIQNNVGSNLGALGVYTTPLVLTAGDSSTLVYTSSWNVLDNAWNVAAGNGLYLQLTETATSTGNVSVNMPIQVSRNKFSADTSGPVQITMNIIATNNAMASETGAITINSNTAPGIFVYLYPQASGSGTITTTCNIQVTDNSVDAKNSYAMNIQRELTLSGDSKGTMTGTLSILRNTLIAENAQAFVAYNIVSAIDDSKGLLIGDFTVSNNTASVYDHYAYTIETEALASVTLVGKTSTATYNGNVVIADNKATLTSATSDDNQFYIWFDGQAYAAGSALGNKWANATLGNIQILRNVVDLNGNYGIGLEYDPDLMSNATYGGSATVTVGTQLVANNEVTGIGNNLYGIKFDLDNLYANSNIGNATVTSGSISIRDNTIDMNGNNSYGINVYNWVVLHGSVNNIYAKASSSGLASFMIDSGLSINSNTIVMDGKGNNGIKVDKGTAIYSEVDASNGLAVLKFNISINNNVLTMPGSFNVGVFLEAYALHYHYYDGNVTMITDVQVIGNNIMLSSITGEGMEVNVPLTIDSTSFNGYATVSAKVSVLNNIVANGDYGIHLLGSGDGIIYVTGNKVTGTNTTALAIEGCNAVVENNVITDNQANGIWVGNNAYSTNIVIGNNTITNNVGIGLWIVNSNGVTMYNGIFETNTGDGIYVPVAEGSTPGSQVKWIINAAASVMDNDVFLGGNVEIMQSGTLTLNSVNDFTIGEAYNGLTMLTVDVDGSMIVQNSKMYSDNDMGLFLVYGNLDMTSSSESEWSEIYLANTSSAQITACTIADNNRNGIHIDGANPTISSTTITTNGMDGIFINNGSKPTIKSCLIALNERGIYARNADLDNVVDNIFVLNSVAGVYVEGVTGNIHANIFLLDKNEIFVYNSVVSIEDNEIGYTCLANQVAGYSPVLSLVLNYLNTSSLTKGLTLGSLTSSSLIEEFAPILLSHVGVYTVNSNVTASDNTYGLLTYAVYSENSTISFSDTVQSNTIVLQWLNSNLDAKNITIPTFVYDGIYMINSKLTMTGANIQCENDAVFLDGSSAVISNSALNASRFDIYAMDGSNVSLSTTTLGGMLKVEDSSMITWLNQFTVIVKDANGNLISGALVTVVDGSGKLIASGNTSSNGQFLANVIGWTQTANGMQSVTTPYWVNATVGGKIISQSVDGGQSQTITAQAQKSLIDSIMLPLLLIIALIVIVVVILVVLRMRKA